MDLLDCSSNGGGDGVSVAVEHIDHHRPTLEFLADDARFSWEAGVVRCDGGHVAQCHSGSGFDEASVADHLLDLVDFLMAFAHDQERRDDRRFVLDFVRGHFSTCL